MRVGVIAFCKMTVFAACMDYVDPSTLLVFLLVFLCAVWLLSPSSGPINWPPGPKPWPIIGNADLFWNNRQVYLMFTELAKTYGEIVHLRAGRKIHMVILTGNDIIREAFVDKGEVFSNRPTFPLTKYTSNNKGRPYCRLTT